MRWIFRKDNPIFAHHQTSVPLQILHEGQSMSRSGPFGPGFFFCFEENISLYFRFTNNWWSLNIVDAFSATETLLRRRFGIKLLKNPRISFWTEGTFGDRPLPLFSTISCYFNNRFSAISALVPLGLINLTVTCSRCPTTVNSTFIPCMLSTVHPARKRSKKPKR